MEKGFHISLIGGAHKQNGKPMQDYSSAVKGEGYDIAIVCDGHGSDKHFRSHVGSRLATEVAKEKLAEFAMAYPTYKQANKNFRKKAERLRLSIVAAWMKRIEQDYTENPFTADELKLGVDPGVDYFSRYSKLVPYGTTMLAVLLGRDYYVALMIGDGVIIRMTPDQDAVEETFEGKKLGDRVESMCNQDAAFKIYSKCVEIAESEKDMSFVLCSDGFCESEAFTSRELMRNWPKRYIKILAKYGMEQSLEGVSEQLRQISDVSMAQDDISIAIAVKNPNAYIEAERFEAKNDKPSAEASENTEAPAEAPAKAPENAEAPAEAPAKASENTEAPAEAPAKASENAEAPAEAPAKAPESAEAPAEAPAKAPENTEAPAEAPAKAPENAEVPAEAPAKASENTEAPAEAPAKAPESAEAPAEAPAKAPENAEAPAEAPAKAPENTEAPAEANAEVPESTKTPAEANAEVKEVKKTENGDA